MYDMGMKLVPGRKMNKIICLVCLIPGVLFSAVAFVYRLLGRREISSALSVLAVIFAAFSLLYGFLLLCYGAKEKKTQQALSAAEPVVSGNGLSHTVREFRIPREHLIAAAEKRFLRILKGLGVMVPVVGALMALCIGIGGAWKSPLQIVYICIFCTLIAIPGIVIQSVIYSRYSRSIPERIILSPGKLVIDRTVFPSSDIMEIGISSDRLANPSSPSVYREMLVWTSSGMNRYRIDFRQPSKDGSQPRWEEYPAMVDALSAWGRENRVNVVVNYMD